MSPLYTLFAEMIPHRVRRQVNIAVLKAPLVYNGWQGEEGMVCPLTAAALAADPNLDLEMFGGIDPVTLVANSLHIDSSPVQDAFFDWDTMSQAEQDQFLAFLRGQLATLPADQGMAAKLP